MKGRAVQSLLVVLCVFHGVTGDDFEPADIISAHHTIRNNVQPPATHMLGLTYGTLWAFIAQSRADQCLNRQPKCFSGYGENFYASLDDPSVSEVLAAWEEEKQWYNFDNNTCSAPPGRTCSNYKQVVMANTNQIGCAKTICDFDSPFGDANNGTWYYVVCIYAPGGTNHQERPYSKAIDPCASGPCLNQGVCNDVDDETYSCTCVDGFSGTNCETVDNEDDGDNNGDDDDGSSSQDGDPHIITFDGAKLTYQGPCRYVLIRTDDRTVVGPPPFAITVRNQNPKDKVSLLEDVEVIVGKRKVRATIHGEIYVDGVVVDQQNFPLKTGAFTIMRSLRGNVLKASPKRAVNEPVIRIETTLLVNVTITVLGTDGRGSHYMNIEVPTAYRGKVQGLGGNFNGNPEDDYELADGTDVRDILPPDFRSQMIADSWLVKDDPDNYRYPCRAA